MGFGARPTWVHILTQVLAGHSTQSQLHKYCSLHFLIHKLGIKVRISQDYYKTQRKCM